ncbi:MAG TPA: TetR/AcrR family transcriptional regulator [Burkholderiales bacterium]|nr:TetR/AcrR family transcriptional regulator [Burkholderiales bacterium]
MKAGERQRMRAPRARAHPARPPARRLPRAERERAIIQHAVRFFAEVGFGGDTRELAKRAHVTQALLFRYFHSKDALVERVYHEVYLGRWNPYWEMLIQDRSIPLRERMVRFYRLYARTILSYEFVRLLMFAGLRGGTLTRRWFALVAERIVLPICREIRVAHALPDFDRVPPTQTEVELVWSVNSRVFYYGVRKYIYGMPVPDNLDAMIEAEVHTFFDGVASTLKDLFAHRASAPRGRRNRATPQRRGSWS